MLWPKTHSYKEFDNEKNSCGSKIPFPPNHFSNVPSLRVTLDIASQNMHYCVILLCEFY